MSFLSAGRHGRRKATTPADTSTSISKARNEKQARQSRRSLTCTNCRSRKVETLSYPGCFLSHEANSSKTKCDGSQPSCKTCEVYQDDCRYERPPPMSQIIAMSERLQEYEHIIEDLRKRISSPANSRSSPLSDGEQLEIPSAPERDTHSDYNKDSRARAELEPSTVAVEPTSRALVSDLSVDEHGKVRYREFFLVQ
jgi:hypothetical protein